jgi:hypothetical protein
MSRKQQWNSPFRSSIVSLAATTAAAAAFFAGERGAAAQTRFGDQRQLAITAENLFIFSGERQAESFPTGDRVETTNRFGILLSDRQDQVSGLFGSSVTPHIPQIGGHYFVIPNLSVGGTIGYENRGGSVTGPPVPNNVLVTVSKPDAATFVFAPKVGYALMFTNSLGFWFRGGITFLRVGASSAVDSRDKESVSYWMLSADALFVVAPVQHFGFYVGPQADISLGGSHSATNVQGNGIVIEGSQNRSFRDILVGTGLIGYFDL